MSDSDDPIPVPRGLFSAPLTRTDRDVWTQMAALANRNGELVMNQKDLAEAIGCSPVTVGRSVNALAHAGFLRIEPRTREDGRGWGATRYVLPLPKRGCCATQ